MSIIGIVASQRQTNEIKRQIKQEESKVELISINYKSIENIKNIKFEILVIQDSLEKLQEKKEYLREIIRNTKYLLLNADIIINKDIFKNINLKTITYGLKQKSTIIASAIGEKQVVISIQRCFKNINNNIVEQQEIPVEVIRKTSKDLYNTLIKISIINICDTEKH